MTTDIRDRAAKAARDEARKVWKDWVWKSQEDINPAHCFQSGYLLGHAAGYADGARAFAEWLKSIGAEIEYLEDPHGAHGGGELWCEETPEIMLARFLASRPAPGTGIAENETNRPEGDRE